MMLSILFNSILRFSGKIFVLGIYNDLDRQDLESEFVKPSKESRNRFLVWRVSTITLFDVTARQAT